MNGHQSAFPSEFLQNIVGAAGMGLSKRELFAAIAMNGMLSNSTDCQQGIEPLWHGSPDKIADDAVTFADALLNRLDKHEEK